jgi:hypothetical protein
MSCTHDNTLQELDIHIVEGPLNLRKQRTFQGVPFYLYKKACAV